MLNRYLAIILLGLCLSETRFYYSEQHLDKNSFNVNQLAKTLNILEGGSQLASFQNLKGFLDIETNSLGKVGNINKSISRDKLNVCRHKNKKEKLSNI